MKKDVPSIWAQQEDEVRAVLESEAAKVGAQPLSIGGQDWMSYEEHGSLIFQGESGLLDLPMPRLGGRHQLSNAGTAIATVRQVLPEISDEQIAKGLTSVDWPARLQRLTSGHLFDQLPKGSEFWLDGGHNPHAGLAVASAFADLEEKAPRTLHMIVGMLNTKDPAGYFSPFKGLAKDIITVPIEGNDAALDPVDLAQIAQQAGIPASAAGSIEEAFKRLTLMNMKPAPRILVAGSLYLAWQYPQGQRYAAAVTALISPSFIVSAGIVQMPLASWRLPLGVEIRIGSKSAVRSGEFHADTMHFLVLA